MVGVMKIPRCGSCHFGKIIPQDFSKRICFGAPPSATQVMSNGKIAAKMSRPIVSVTDDACALYRDKDASDKERDNTAVLEQQSGMIRQ